MTARASILVLVAVVLATGAGVAAGLVAARWPGSGSVAASGGPQIVTGQATLSQELKLNPVQREQMRQIWEGVQEKVQGSFDQARAIQRARDDELVALLNDEQKAKFETISEKYRKEFDHIVTRRDRVFKEAVERTKSILTAEQREVYEKMLEARLGKSSTGPRTAEDLLASPPLPGEGSVGAQGRNP